MYLGGGMMSLTSDYCPYCDYELDYDDVFEPADINGTEEDIEVECSSCGRIMRASIEIEPHLSLMSEDDYLENLKRLREGAVARLGDRYFKDYKHLVLEDIEKLTKEIEQVKKNLKINSEVE